MSDFEMWSSIIVNDSRALSSISSVFAIRLQRVVVVCVTPGHSVSSMSFSLPEHDWAMTPFRTSSNVGLFPLYKGLMSAAIEWNKHWWSAGTLNNKYSSSPIVTASWLYCADKSLKASLKALTTYDLLLFGEEFADVDFLLDGALVFVMKCHEMYSPSILGSHPLCQFFRTGKWFWTCTRPLNGSHQIRVAWMGSHFHWQHHLLSLRVCVTVGRHCIHLTFHDWFCLALRHL